MKRILTTLSLKWPEYLLEILVLIIGIYGAFQMEDFRVKKEKDEMLKANLRLLSLELTDNGYMREGFLDSLIEVELSKANWWVTNLEKMQKTELANFRELNELMWFGHSDSRPYALDIMINDGTFSLLKNETLIFLLLVTYPDLRETLISPDFEYYAEKHNTYYNQLENEFNERIHGKDSIAIQTILDQISHEDLIGVLRVKAVRSEYQFRTFKAYRETILTIDSLIQIEIAR